jgi:hypothetical protein
MVVFEVIGQLCKRFVHAFMIAGERSGWTSLIPKRGLIPYFPDEIVRGMADREEDRRAQTQRNSVSFSQSEWSNAASLRATATLARLAPLASASFLPHCWSANGRLTLDNRTFAASYSDQRNMGSPALEM